MANLDYNIASGIRPIQLESPINQLAQVYQLKSMQEASQMNALKMQEAQRESQQRNALARLNPSSPTYLEDVQRISPELGFKYKKLISESEAAGTTQQEAKAKLFNTKLSQSRQFLEGIDPNSPTAVQEYLNWHVNNHKDEILGPLLAQRGVTLESSRAHIDQAIKSGRLADLIEESKLGIEKFAQFKPGMQKAAMEKFDQDYSDYVAAGGELTRSQFKETRNRQPTPAVASVAAAAPAVIPTDASVAPVDVNAPAIAAPVSRIDANNVTVTAAPRQVIDTINYGGQSSARFAPEAQSVAVAAPAAASGKKLELPGIHPEAAKLYSTKVLEDKTKADVIQRVYELSLKSEDKRSDMAQLQADRDAALLRKDKKSANELQQRINKLNKDETPEVSPEDMALISKAMLEGRLAPNAVTNRNMRIIAGTLRMKPDANLKDLVIDAAAQTKVIKDFASGVEARQVKSFNTAIDHLDTLDKLANALNNNDMRAFNAASNYFAKETGKPAPGNFDLAKAVVGGEVAKALTGSNMALKDREEIRDQILSSASPAQLKGRMATLKQLLGGQLNSLNTQYEAGAGRQDFDKWLSPASKRELQKLRGESSGAAPPPVGGVLKPEVKTLLDKYK